VRYQTLPFSRSWLRYDTTFIDTLIISGNRSLDTLSFNGVPSPHNLCVWALPFPPDGVELLYQNENQEVVFSTGCPTDTIVNIPDTKFLIALIDNGVDSNQDSLISITEAENVFSLQVGFRGIKDLKGIEAFINLDTLICSGNDIGKLDLTYNVTLKYLNCSNNELCCLNISNCLLLEYLDCHNGDSYFYTRMSVPDISFNKALKYMDCSKNRISYLDLSTHDSLMYVDCSENILNRLVTSNKVLKSLDCSRNALTFLDVSLDTALETLNCGQNRIDILDLSGNPALEYLSCYHNQLRDLDLSKNKSLKSLICGGVFRGSAESNFLTRLDLASNLELKHLNCTGNMLTQLDLSKLTGLKSLSCVNNQLSNLDLSGNTLLKKLDCSSNLLPRIDLSNNTLLEYLSCGDYSAFYSYSGTNISNYYPGNPLVSLDLSNNSALREFKCNGTALENLDFSQNDSITIVTCRDNLLTVLDIYNKNFLTELKCTGNLLSNLNISGDTALVKLWCYGNQLTNLDISDNRELISLSCGNNNLTSLDVSNCSKLEELRCSSNQLTTLNLSNNHALFFLDITKMPELHKVCVFNGFFEGIYPYFDFDEGSPNVEIRMDCDCSTPTIPTELQAMTIEEYSVEIAWNHSFDNVGVSGYRVYVDSVLWGTSTDTTFSLSGLSGNTEYHIAVSAYDSSGNESVKSFPLIVITLSSSTYIQDLTLKELKGSIRIYPNPVREILQIHSKLSEKLLVEIAFSDGQVLMIKEFYDSNFHIDLSSFKAGFYFIIIRTNSSYISRKIVKL